MKEKIVKKSFESTLIKKVNHRKQEKNNGVGLS